MSGVITRGNFPKFLWPGVNSTFGMSYKNYENGAEYKQVFAMDTSSQAFEEDVALTGLGLVPVKPEGDQTSYDTMKQGYVTRYTHSTFALGFIVTMEEIDDNLYAKVANQRARNLSFVFAQTKEIIGANILNRAFSNTYPGGDLVSLCNGSHPIETGTYSNLLTPAADLSEASLEQAIINIGKFVDNRGNKIAVKPQKLVVPIDNEFVAKRILGNPDRPDTADRDINAMYQMKSIPQGFVVNHYLTDQDAWFVLTDTPDSLKYFQRQAMRFTNDNDFDTENFKAKGMERFSFGWTDARGIYGSAGA